MKTHPIPSVFVTFLIMVSISASATRAYSQPKELSDKENKKDEIRLLDGKATLEVKTLSGVKHQMIDGFGASDAWRSQFVGKNWPTSKKNKVADLLFSQAEDKAGNPKGIGLSIWRFYLSSGTTEQEEASEIGNPWRRGECFLNTEKNNLCPQLPFGLAIEKAGRQQKVGQFNAETDQSRPGVLDERILYSPEE